ncbi:hypothetical protein GW932_03330 [archaeon]|nr:hypothetical protein [archaeon]
MSENTGYLVGSFSGTEWRDRYIENNPQIIWEDPRYHEQSSIKRLVTSDISSARNNEFPVGHRRKGKALGTMSYAEMAEARAKGKTIIVTDENEENDSILEKIASYYTHSEEDTYNLLKNPELLQSKYSSLPVKTTFGKYEKIFFAGDTHSILDLTKKLNQTKQIVTNGNLENFSNNVDLVVINFEEGWNDKGVFYLGLAHALNIPSIILEGNNLAYPPLTGIANKTFFGKERYNNLEKFLYCPNDFEFSLNTELEMNLALNYANENGFEGISKTSVTTPCKNVYFGGDTENLKPTIHSLKHSGKKQIKNITKDTDLIVVNFECGPNLTGLKEMYLGYKAKIPVILLSKEEELHKEIAELSRRPLVGEKRFEQLNYYLENLNSQHINDEAVLYYKLMEKFK